MDDYKCIVCGEEKKVLITVEVQSDAHSIFTRHRGVCQKCIKEKDIEEVCNNFVIRKIDEDIEKAKGSLEFLEEQKKQLKSKEIEDD